MSEPNHRIDTMYAFISEDETGEGVCAFMTSNGTWLPMVGADWSRVESLVPVAQEIAKASRRKVHLVEFTTRVELRMIEP